MAKPNRPTAVLVIAILHLVFGSLGLLCSIIQASGAGKQLQQMQAKMDPKQGQLQEKLEQALEAEIPGYSTVEMASSVVSMFLCFMLLACGVGLLGMHVWARFGSIAYGVVSILFHLLSVIYAFVFVVPAMNNVFKGLAKDNPQMDPQMAKAMEMGGTIGATVGAMAGCAGMIYPTAVLIVMFLPRVRAAFDRAGRGESPYEPGAAREEDDFGYDRRDYGGDQGY
jgi:hypothetical protein